MKPTKISLLPNGNPKKMVDGDMLNELPPKTPFVCFDQSLKLNILTLTMLFLIA